MSIGCFLIELCACFFAIFALHRTLAGGFSTHATSTVELLMRELEFEFVAVSSYFFAGTVMLMGPLGIRCFCMVQQGLRSDTLAASVMCLIVGVELLILSFFNAHLQHFPFNSFEEVLGRFVVLSFRRCVSGGSPATITQLAWILQSVSLALAACSLVETLPWYYYRDECGPECMQEDAADAIEAAAAVPESAERTNEAPLERENRSAPDPISEGEESDKANTLSAPPPWQLAMTSTDPRLGAAPVAPHPQQRVASFTKSKLGIQRISSITSSINSLDSGVVD